MASLYLDSSAIVKLVGALHADGLRSLDAIHLAAARRLGEELTFVVTYDRRMASAADAMRLPVASPT